jgi:hypothetical protein
MTSRELRLWQTRPINENVGDDSRVQKVSWGRKDPRPNPDAV